MAETCKRCGSARVIPEVALTAYSGELAQLPVRASVSGAPHAWVFKDTVAGEVKAQICGECGYTELHTANHRELYDRYEQSLPS